MTDGEPHVMASPVRLIAPLYQIHPRLARGCGPGHVDDVVSPNIRVRSVDPFSLSTVTRFFSSISSITLFQEFYLEIRLEGILEEKFYFCRKKYYWEIIFFECRETLSKVNFWKSDIAKSY